MTDAQIVALLDRFEAKLDVLLEGKARQDEQLIHGRERFTDMEVRLRKIESGSPVAVKEAADLRKEVVAIKTELDVIAKEVWTRQGVIAFLAGIAGSIIGVLGALWVKATHPGS